jgi:hypothetical protein
MFSQLLCVLANSNDFCVHVLLESGKRLGRILRVPDRTGGHTENLGPQSGLSLEVLTHNPIICVVLPAVVAFVKYHQGDLQESKEQWYVADSRNEPSPYSNESA